MAATSRCGIDGWRQADDATTQSRAGADGWYQVVAVAAGFKAAWARCINVLIGGAVR